MAKPVKLDDDLVSEAAGLGSEDMGEPPAPDESEDGGKADFMRMCAAIRDGDDEAAWAAYQACAGMGADDAGDPLDMG